jgi:monovalent cation:H+ antiporter-2, CPA2 family
MIHLPILIQDLAIILVAAAGVGLLFRRLGQPIVLGYLLAGVLVGPQVSFLPTVQDKEGIKVWAEIGVIFLLFGLGLEFSFRKLAKVGRGAGITALVEIIGMLGVGYLLGQWLGFGEMDSIFLGAILCISSTTIIIKAVEELGLKQRRFVQLVFGVLVVEDLVAILILVLLSTIAASQVFSGLALATSLGKLGFFLVVWLLGGLVLVPWVMNLARPYLNRETTLLLGVGLCLSMVFLAAEAGFSAALGAFIMGSLLAETEEGPTIEKIVTPLRDFFGAVFFVSVGMLLDLSILAQHWGAILLICLVTVLGKIGFTLLGALLAGQRLRHSLQAGMSLAQIGEFSFIIATLGLSLGVISNLLYPAAVAVSVVTTFLTPYLIRSSDTVYGILARNLPPSLLERLEGEELSNPSNVSGQWWKEGLRFGLNTIVVVAVSLAGSEWLLPWALSFAISDLGTRSLVLLSTFLLSSPFLWVIAVGKNSSTAGSTSGLDSISSSRRWLVVFSRWLWIAFLVAFLVQRILPGNIGFLVLTVLGSIFLVLAYQRLPEIYGRFEASVVRGFSRPEKNAVPPLAPWDAQMSVLEVGLRAPGAGQTLVELGLRERFGVTIAWIERGHRAIPAPGRGESFPR